MIVDSLDPCPSLKFSYWSIRMTLFLLLFKIVRQLECELGRDQMQLVKLGIDYLTLKSYSYL